jgi:hypothetical protein
MNSPIYQIDDAGWYTEPELWQMTKVEFQCAMTEHGGFQEVMKLAEQHGVIFDFRNDPSFDRPEENIKFVPCNGLVALAVGDHRPASQIVAEIRRSLGDRRTLLVDFPQMEVIPEDVRKYVEDWAGVKVLEPRRCTPETFDYLPEDEVPSTRAQRRHGHRARNTGKGPRKEWWNT